GGRTRPDNIFITEGEADWINICEVREEDTPPQADHFPIITSINLAVQRSTKERAWNFRATDWGEFREKLKEKLGELAEPGVIERKEDVDGKVEELERVVKEVMEKVVPKSNPSPYAKRWWTKELDGMRKHARKMMVTTKRFREFPLHSSHEGARTARNNYSKAINKAKQDHWENWLEGISTKTIWDSHRFTSTPASD
ncbi:hypothetical protein BYT27DRAFT_7046625, partial [Phlegmacium glaucopus]